MLKRADWFYPLGSKGFTIFSEQAKPAFILKIQVYRFVVFLKLVADILAGLTEVFLKVETASSSFFT